MEVASIIASIVSLIVGLIAGGLAIYFFLKSKDDANRVEVALAEIREQTNSLQAISAGFLDRLTRYVTTEPRHLPDSNRAVLDTLKELPAVVQMLQVSTTSASSDADESEITTLIVALQYYVAETNFWASVALPDVGDFDADNKFHNLTKDILERSMGDLDHVSNMLQDRDLSCLKGTNVEGLHDETINILAEFVGDAATHWTKRAKEDKDKATKG